MHFTTLGESLRSWLSTQPVGSTSSLEESLIKSGQSVSRRHLVRLLEEEFGGLPPRSLSDIVDGSGHALNGIVIRELEKYLTKGRKRVMFLRLCEVGDAILLVANDRRGELWWVNLRHHGTASEMNHGSERSHPLRTLKNLIGTDVFVVAVGRAQGFLASLEVINGVTLVDYAHSPLPHSSAHYSIPEAAPTHDELLDTLQAESIRIIREAAAVASNPAMLFSMGKDSMVMLTLARKAFWPEALPFPLVMIDTRWKFREMYRFRENMQTQSDLRVIVHVNPDAIRDDINPFDHGSAHHTDVTKTQALRQVLDIHKFDFVFGGARRDEEKSRAKERVFSVRSPKHGWDPKNQRPELWNLYNTRLTDGQSMRVFPLSNWTELDVWRYIEREGIDLVPLYFSKVRPFVERNGSLIMVDDERFRLEPDETIHFEPIRFRTLGCYPLTGGMRSHATTVRDIIEELEKTRVSERSSRVIDFDPGSSMEQKKKEGYF